VKIELRAQQPPTTWSAAAPDEYGFFANVNPKVDIRAGARRRSEGSASASATPDVQRLHDQVASLYSGMDLRANF